MKFPFIRPHYYWSLFNDIWGFIRTPKNQIDYNKSTKYKIYDTIGLFILKLLFLIPIAVLVGLIHDPENLTGTSLAERFSPVGLLLVAGFILPLIEEICFRLSLKFKPVYLALSSTVLVYYILTKIVYRSKISAVDDSFLMRLGCALVAGFILFLIVRRKPTKSYLAQFWNKNFRAIYYISCLAFAWIHIFNYELSFMTVALFPLITLPQLLSGIINGYTRVVFGFQYPLLFHISTNVLAIGLSMLPFADGIS